MTSKNNPHDPDIFDADDYLKDPEFAAAYAAAEVRSHLLAALVGQRKSSGMRQVDVAKAMQTTPFFVSDLENGATDAHLSTLRYANAVSARLVLRMDIPGQGAADPKRTWAQVTDSSRYVNRRITTKPVSLALVDGSERIAHWTDAIDGTQQSSISAFLHEQQDGSQPRTCRPSCQPRQRSPMSGFCSPRSRWRSFREEPNGSVGRWNWNLQLSSTQEMSTSS